MKYRILFVMIFIFSVIINVTAANDDIKLYVNNKAVVCDVPPVIVNNRTIVPARALFESLGASCEWNGENQEVTISLENTKLLFKINSAIAYVNGDRRTLEAAPIILNSRTMLPARFVAEELGYSVDWIAEKRIVDIKSDDYVEFISDIYVKETAKTFTLNIEFPSPLEAHKIYPLDAPKRLVLELSGFNYMTPLPIDVGKNNIQKIRMANHEGFFKIVFDLDIFLPYKIEISDDKKHAELTFTYVNTSDSTPTPSVSPTVTPSTTPSEQPTPTPSPSATPEAGRYFTPNPLVVIDAGHGGSDSGTLHRNANGEIEIMEKDINLDIANKVTAVLKENGIRVESTRTTDVALPLKGRSEFANELGAELFVSVHVNYFDNPSSNGTLTLYSDTKDTTFPDKMSSKEIASVIQEKLHTVLGTRNAGTRSEADLSVLRNTTMPAVLIETGFISNEFDRSVLSDANKRTVAANAIAEAIIEILKN